MDELREQVVDQSRWVRDDEIAIVCAGTRSVGDDLGNEEARELFGAGLRDHPIPVAEMDVLLHGGADSDQLAADAGERLGLEPVVYNPVWEWTSHDACVVRSGQYGEYNAAAGPWRNQVLCEDGDGLFALWDGDSNGTRSMLDLALGDADPQVGSPMQRELVTWLTYDQ